MGLRSARRKSSVFFFFNDTATTEIYTLSLHDALPIYVLRRHRQKQGLSQETLAERAGLHAVRSEEHTSELQSRPHLVCRLLLEKKKTKQSHRTHYVSRILYRLAPTHQIWNSTG